MDTGATPSGSGGHHLSLGKSIAVAESISSGVSLGAVWLVGKNPQMIAPAKHFLAKHVFYPSMGKHGASGDAECNTLMEQAEHKASVLLKGMIMVGTSFASHLPIQMMLEGKHDVKELKKVIIGKSVGLAAAMGTLAFVDYIRPGTIGSLEDRLGRNLFNCNQGMSKAECEANKEKKEMCKLMMVDSLSSVIAGVTNYQITSRFK